MSEVEQLIQLMEEHGVPHSQAVSTAEAILARPYTAQQFATVLQEYEAMLQAIAEQNG